ncbi:MAG: carbohydrate kinase [Deltaproteobacteria bacterium]|nr:carbohydrate kinase [Deltaproteobacteria bacterium]
MEANKVDLLLVGALARDEDVVAGLTEHRIGGAVYFGSYAAQAAGARTSLWTAISEADRKLLDPLRQDGIGVHICDSPHTAGIRNIYESADRDRRQCQLISRARPLTAEEMPDTSARIIHVCPLMAGEVEESVFSAAASRAQLSLDAQGVVRKVRGDQLVFEAWTGQERLLPLVHFLKCDTAEAEFMTGLTRPDDAARALADQGAQEVLVTRPDGVSLWADGRIWHAPFTHRGLEGRTGRGDTCMSSYLARRLNHEPEAALRFAAALTSIKMETPGPFRGDLKAVQKRMAQMP